ncbi:hypothetical protein C1I99_06830 [Micromonospora deserti]|uniref:Uncharacterized protein n=1 Tax=Micromonospora deserti TaxID=2070366 RepID=A0A2W2DWE7_9ACTN|nr:hypothetical protein C1I99_06830 [Micromonospora deserti]
MDPGPLAACAKPGGDVRQQIRVPSGRLPGPAGRVEGTVPHVGIRVVHAGALWHHLPRLRADATAWPLRATAKMSGLEQAGRMLPPAAPGLGPRGVQLLAQLGQIKPG